MCPNFKIVKIKIPNILTKSEAEESAGVRHGVRQLAATAEARPVTSQEYRYWMSHPIPRVGRLEHPSFYHLVLLLAVAAAALCCLSVLPRCDAAAVALSSSPELPLQSSTEIYR